MKVYKFLFISIIMFSFSSFAADIIIPQSLSKTGLNKESLQDFFYENYIQKKTTLEKNCVHVTELKEKGENTEKLFQTEITKDCLRKSISFNEPDYIVKELKNGEIESTNLETIKNAGILKKTNFYFNIILPLEIIKYKKQKNDDLSPDEYTYFSIMEKAKGEDISKIIETKDEDDIDLAMMAYGKALAQLHLSFIDKDSIPENEEDLINNPIILQHVFKSIIHRDPHWKNVFYDYKNNLISFIDNETIASSIEGHSPIVIDIMRVLYYSTEKFGLCNKSDFNPEKCDHSIRASTIFLDEYIQTYPSKYQKKLVTYLKIILPKALQLFNFDVDAKSSWHMIINSLTTPEHNEEHDDPILGKRKTEAKNKENKNEPAHKKKFVE